MIPEESKILEDRKIIEEKGIDPKIYSHFSRFIETVPRDSDSVPMILSCHLSAEYYLDRIITAKIPRGDIITDSRFEFHEKLIIIEALATLDKNLLDSLKKLNSVRNSCSHVLNYQISETDVDKIGQPFGKNYIREKEKFQLDLKSLLRATLMMIAAKLARSAQDMVDKKITEA